MWLMMLKYKERAYLQEKEQLGEESKTNYLSLL